jgi:hypothetical protein
MKPFPAGRSAAYTAPRTVRQGFRSWSGPAAFLAGFARAWRAVLRTLGDHLEFEYGSERGAFAALHASLDLRMAAHRAGQPPVATVGAAAGCVNCGVIQAPPANHRCGHCGSESLFDAGRVMQREAKRLGKVASFAAGRKRTRKSR